MTASECIGYIDGIEPNAYTAEQKLGWVSECEGKVYSQLFLTQPYEFLPVTEGDRILALPAPYDRIYPRYLQAMIHYANGEYDRYANSMAVFNEAWGEANRWFGGDYDVTDRLRNRRFEAGIDPEEGEQVILEIPRGCAVAAGRILVGEAFTAAHPTYYVPEALAGGTYCVKLSGGYVHFTLSDTAAGTKLWIDSDLYILAPGSSIPGTVSLVSGKDGTELDFTPAARIWQGDPSNIAGTVLLDKKGAAPLPMLTGERVGITFGPGYWDTPGEIRLTGYLLIPDQEWAYDSAYAGRRDARWRS